MAKLLTLNTTKKATPGKGKAPVRLPQRSEAVSGNEKKGLTPIAAAQKKKSPRKARAKTRA